MALLAAMGINNWVLLNRETAALGKPFAAAVRIARMQDAVWRLRFGVAQYVNVADPDARQRIIDDEPKNVERFESAANEYDKLPLSDAEREGMKAIREAYTRYMAARPRWLDLMRSGRSEEGADFRARNLTPAGDTLVEALEKQGRTQVAGAEENVKARIAASQQSQVLILVLLAVAIAVSAAAAYFITRSITLRLKQIQNTVGKVSEGDLAARIKLAGRDEIGEVANAFDGMLEQRVAMLAQIQKDNERLNESVLTLLQSVAKLAQRDLTVRVPVAEDTTGVVSDALNQLTNETRKVLGEVTSLSADVAAASAKVKEQTDSVMAVAAAERGEIERATRELATAAVAMGRIAELAHDSNKAADAAIQSTQAALETVSNTVGGIANTRDTIRETERRIKRLGERSQEISGVVNLINTIAERTHILALNASMHAASAGEAGRGFAVVADEVQRLAENARQATSQIATLVNNIQIETAETVTAMNTAISQVVEGSKLAEQAGEQMRRTRDATAGLVEQVRQIASTSQDQAKITNELVQSAEGIRRSTQKTSEQLEVQTLHTNNLLEYAKSLLATVRVFKLA